MKSRSAGALSPQALAAGVVENVLAGRNLNDALGEALADDIEPRARAAAQDLSYGTVRYYARLEFVLQALITRAISTPVLRGLLLVALYQLIYSKTRPYAVVHGAVEAARALKLEWATGFVNGVLRNFSRQRAALLARADTQETARYSHPQWWIDRLRALYPDQWAELLSANNDHPLFTLRVNSRRTSVETYLTQLAAAGLGARQIGPVAVALARPVAVTRLPGFADGWVSVQDLGAQYAAPMLDLKPGQRVLDACAAPGGKAAHILESEDVALTALDRDPIRLARVSENMQRLGLRATLLVGDATAADWWDGRPFDRILADVPCSASGVVRRHPDIKWLRRPADIARFAAGQQAILANLWRLLAPGGKLLYVTCSVFPEENAELVAGFLALHPDAQRLPLSGLPAQDGQLLPDAHHDGFFYALLGKTA